eukprot:CAMPEP_0174853386 /NCGR_PEP_ID=MMETSP1114-20130205/28223_1 /TAXON_ID=312471 /ORGANISM="Neobodo designis, Strain CCAP 1951/1" /LENGTH=129 /DNA_ID=CAMNT_0016088029 /DNA_START=86 /DNA_END=472 /DNA_ORIENTATION=-
MSEVRIFGDKLDEGARVDVLQYLLTCVCGQRWVGEENESVAGRGFHVVKFVVIRGHRANARGIIGDSEVPEANFRGRHGANDVLRIVVRKTSLAIEEPREDRVLRLRTMENVQFESTGHARNKVQKLLL